MAKKKAFIDDEVTTEQYHDTKYTAFGGILQHLFIRLNNAFVSSGRPEDSYISLINHLEDMISPFIDGEYYLVLKKFQDKAKVQLKIALNISSDVVLMDEHNKLLDYQTARARLRACNWLIAKKFNFYPIRTDIDTV